MAHAIGLSATRKPLRRNAQLSVTPYEQSRAVPTTSSPLVTVPQLKSVLGAEKSFWYSTRSARDLDVVEPRGLRVAVAEADRAVRVARVDRGVDEHVVDVGADGRADHVDARVVLGVQADRHRQPDGLELRVGAVDLHVRAQLVGAVAADLPHEAVGAVDAELDAGGDGRDGEVDVDVVVRAQDGGAGPDRRRRPGRFDRGAEARRGCVRGRPVALERADRPVQAGRVRAAPGRRTGR